ncbi:MAG: efflux RND transporter periplasmic adaptor subunit [Bacteroidales bacterium]|nr:efflux RND transporter periplasmic adaptor subunit [Bacteroidales bacterium]
MKYGILAAIIIFMASCSSNQETEQSIRDQITAYKKEVGTLNGKISDLEKKLLVMNTEGSLIEKVPVEVLSLSLEPFDHYIEVSGTAEAVKEAFISPEVGGQIREIYVNEGDYVEKGRLLAKLNTEVTESSIADMKTSLDLATVVYEKQKRLWEKGIGSEIQYLNAKNNKESLEQKLVTLNAQLDMAMIKSPVSGIVDKIYHKRGELAMPGAQLMQIVNLEELYINADVSEKYLGQVNEGEQVKIEFPVYPDMSFEVPIYRKGNVINPNNRTFAVQLKVKNPDRLLKPNILSVIHINDFSADSAIVVPSALIKQDITGSYLYTMQQIDNKWIARKVYVTTGQSYLDKTMVTNGLQAGQTVIVQGYNLVSDGTEVYVKSNDAS